MPGFAHHYECTSHGNANFADREIGIFSLAIGPFCRLFIETKQVRGSIASFDFESPCAFSIRKTFFDPLVQDLHNFDPFFMENEGDWTLLPSIPGICNDLYWRHNSLSKSSFLYYNEQYIYPLKLKEASSGHRERRSEIPHR